MLEYWIYSADRLEEKLQEINVRRENGEEKLLNSGTKNMHTYLFTHTYTHFNIPPWVKLI